MVFKVSWVIKSHQVCKYYLNKLNMFTLLALGNTCHSTSIKIVLFKKGSVNGMCTNGITEEASLPALET